MHSVFHFRRNGRRALSSLSRLWNWRYPNPKHQPDALAGNQNIAATADHGEIIPSHDQPSVAARLQLLLNNSHPTTPGAASDQQFAAEFERCCHSLTVTDDLVTDVIKRHGSDWQPAYRFFLWAIRREGSTIGPAAYNEILDVLGRLHRFVEISQLLDELSKREGVSVFDQGTYTVLLKRLAAAHKLEEAVELFDKRRQFGVSVDADLASFRELLMWLCRCKHVQEAEALFYSRRSEFRAEYDIKTMNIILDGWCVLGSVREAKRFWKEIIASKCRPDRFTCAIFIHALTKKGKLGSALKLFREMWDKGPHLDVVVCNCIIDALCFKKRVPEALEVFELMRHKGCDPNYATYNSIIKHMCKIHRTEVVNEMLKQMVSKGGNCLPTARTYTYLLKSLKKPEQVPEIMQMMERNGTQMNADLYNLVLKLYVGWDHEEGVESTWREMETRGLGPDKRSYTIMIHGHYKRGRVVEAKQYWEEMVAKGMPMEPKTMILMHQHLQSK